MIKNNCNHKIPTRSEISVLCILELKMKIWVGLYESFNINLCGLQYTFYWMEISL